MRLGEGKGRAPRVCAISEMEGEPWVRALRGRGVRGSEMRCAQSTISNGDGQGCKVAEENEGFAGIGVLAKWGF